MSGHTGSEHDHDKHHHEHDRTPGDSPETTPKHAFGTAASTVAAKTVSFVTAKLPNKASRMVATAAAGALVLGGAGTAYAVHQTDVSNHNKQVAAEAAAVKLAADEKAAADRAAAEQAAAEQAAAEKAAADKAAADKAAADAAAKAAADKAAADAAAKAAADKAAADKAAADKIAAQRAAAAAAANRDAQRPQLPSSSPSTTSSPKPTSTPKPPVSYGSAYAIAQSMVPSGQFGCFANIIERESGWNVHATNPSSGAYGLGQALPGSKMASAGSDWQNNPTTQIKWVLSYMNSRYGSPCGAWSFWQSHSWY